MDRFYLENYILQKDKRSEEHKEVGFSEICDLISGEFSAEWEGSSESSKLLDLQKNAIIGLKNETEYFKKKIRTLIKEKGLEGVKFPRWYESLEEAIYHEIWGLAGIAEWFSEKYAESSSAKIIGNRIYFMEDGSLKLKEQRISDERRQQLIRAFLLTKPQEKINKDFHELYMTDGTRITVFRNNIVKDGEEVIIFRRYIIPAYTFEEQERRGTIPRGSAKLFENMVKLGFNCAFVGEIRSAKTTFMTTWQSYEDRSLEGVLVETDPEIPLHKIMPEAPIVQLIADGEKLEGIIKNLMRSDADYFILGEARDATALNTALRVADKGGRRLKMTFHLKNPMDFPYDVASEVANGMGGDVNRLAQRAASSFDYLFHFGQLADKSQKRMLGIYEMSTDKARSDIRIEKICEYKHESGKWKWSDNISKEKEEKACKENKNAYIEFRKEFKKLIEMQENETYVDMQMVSENVDEYR